MIVRRVCELRSNASVRNYRKTLTSEGIRFKLYDRSIKFVLLPDKQNVPVIIYPGREPGAHSPDENRHRL